MSKYAKLDAIILGALSAYTPRAFNVLHRHPEIASETSALAAAEPTNQWGDRPDAWRILERRLQALRKGGKIQSSTKGWTRVDAARDGGES